MANIESTPVPPAPPADSGLDTNTGVYGFFRRHQRKLLYTVGLFTLLTFSVGGPMLAAVRDLFERPREMPSILVGGERVKLQPEDFDYGQMIARNIQSLIAVVPPLDAGDAGTAELGDIYAMLRRVAITEGIGVSLVEVDRAIESMRARGTAASATQLASLRGFSSLAQYRTLLAEALRIGTLIRLQTLALDNSDARILQRVIADKEVVTFKVATFDEKALDEKLKAAGGISDDDLRKWLDGKTPADKNRMQVYDTNRVELRFGGVLFADFDAAQWQQEGLEGFTIGDAQRQKVYEQEKETRWKNEDKTWKPLADVTAEVDKLIQSERVLGHLLDKLRERQTEWMKAATDDLNRCNEEHQAAVNAVAAAKAKVAASPEDAAAKEELQMAEQVVQPKLDANRAAEAVLAERRATFDFAAAFAELTKDKKGVVQKAMTGKRNADELKDLDSGELGLGQWPQAVFATYLSNKGDLCNMAGRSMTAAFLYQVSDVEVRPLKAWDKLKPLLEGAYFTEQAKTEAESKKKVLELALLRLAKEKMPAKVAELEGKRAALVAEKLAAFETQAQADLAKAEKTLADPNLGSQALQAWTRRRDDLKAQLAKKEDKQKEFDTEVGAQIEKDIGEEAKKFHAEVLEAAAAEAGFTVTEVGPLPRELPQRPRFDKNYDPTIVFVFQNHADMKAGESTGVVQDVTNRRWHVACATKVEPMTAADVERRDFEALRRGFGFWKSFASLQALEAYGQAFTRKALEERYAYQPPAGSAAQPDKAGPK